MGDQVHFATVEWGANLSTGFNGFSVRTGYGKLWQGDFATDHTGISQPVLPGWIEGSLIYYGTGPHYDSYPLPEARAIEGLPSPRYLVGPDFPFAGPFTLSQAVRFCWVIKYLEMKCSGSASADMTANITFDMGYGAGTIGTGTSSVSSSSTLSSLPSNKSDPPTLGDKERNVLGKQKIMFSRVGFNPDVHASNDTLLISGSRKYTGYIYATSKAGVSVASPAIHNTAIIREVDSDNLVTGNYYVSLPDINIAFEASVHTTANTLWWWWMDAASYEAYHGYPPPEDYVPEWVNDDSIGALDMGMGTTGNIICAPRSDSGYKTVPISIEIPGLPTTTLNGNYDAPSFPRSDSADAGSEGSASYSIDITGITISPSEYWPYKNSADEAVFNTTSGAQINSI